MKIRYFVIIFFFVALSIAATAQSQDQNYIIISSLNETIQYFDGLGRKTQTAIGGYESGNWLNTAQEYDMVGNIRKIWAPIIESSNPEYVPADNLQNETERLYNDRLGYSEIKYDCMGREMFVSQPGEKWSKKGKTKTYRVNTSSEVKKYSPSNMTKFDYFEPNTLSCAIEEDEDHHKTAIFKDFLGRIILERKFDNKSIDTYYVYNSLNQLTYVLQPMYQENPDLNKYAFKYTYDIHGRVKTKTLPGCAPIEYWYDDDNHVIQMQDGVLKNQDKIRKFKYDDNARLVEQSIWSLNVDEKLDHIEIINFYDSYTFLDSLFSVNRIPLCVKNIEAFNFNSLLDNSKGCLTGSIQYTNSGKFILSVNYYDWYYRLTKNFELDLDNNIIFNEFSRDRGRIDVANTKYYKYDNNKYDLMLSSSLLHIYDQDRLTSSILSVQVGDSCCTDTIQNLTCDSCRTDTIRNLIYDDFGHVIANNRSGTAGDMTYEYDNLHGWATRITSAKGFEQRLYRETEGKTRRFNGSISAMTWRMNNSIMRRYDYSYDNMNRLTSADYSHYSITRKSDKSETFNLIPDDDKSVENYSERFQYDKNSNITWLERYGYCSDIDEYDTADAIDIEYNGNQKKSMMNSCFETGYYGSMHGVDGACEDTEYFYDANGNLIQDLNKGMTFEYDLLGHPLKVIGQKNTIEYVYAPDGRKLRATHKTYTAANKKTVKSCTTTDYIGNYVFTNGNPSMFRFDGGYYSFNSKGTLDGCHYYIQDYQGNNRMVVNANTNAVEQMSHYYSYGNLIGNISTKPDAQPFKYGGKELDLAGGLDLLDFEARQYDSEGPGFTSVDPCATDYPHLSPYNYCAGDPINLIDPTGCSTQVIMIDSLHYMVYGGDLDDNDKNIYVVAYNAETDNYERTGQILGESVTINSFYNSDEGKWEVGSVIDLSDNSATTFLSQIGNDKENLLTYMGKGQNGEQYDVKVTNGQKTPLPKGCVFDPYRGMTIPNSEGKQLIGSARDLGNIGAGYKAGSKGLSLVVFLSGCTIYDCYKNGRIGIEPAGSREPQIYGYKLGFKKYLKNLLW